MVHAAPRSSARQYARTHRTEEILAAAQRIALEEGLESLTVHRLAKALSYVPAALYRYFPSKEALVAELIARAAASAASALQVAQELVAEQDGKGAMAARILLAVETYVAWGRQAPHEFALLSLAVGDPRVLVPQDSLAGNVLQGAAPALALVVGLLEEAAAASVLDGEQAAPMRALLLYAAVHGALALRKLTRLAPDAVDVEALARVQARSLLLGWGLKRALLERAETRLSDWTSQGIHRAGHPEGGTP